MNRRTLRTFAAVTALAGALIGASCRGASAPEAAYAPAPLDLDAAVRRALEASPTTRQVLAAADEHRLKLELAVVVPGAAGGATLRRASFDAGPAYWYPASTIKSCAVVAALLELDELAARTGRPIDRDTPLAFYPLFDGEGLEARDPTHERDGTITAAHLARKVLLVSDNPAFNRLYDLCGRDGLDRHMRALGLDGIKIRHRLSVARSLEENGRAPRIDLLPLDGGDLVTLPARDGAPDLGAFEGDGVLVGVASMSGEARVEGPMDFSRRNEARLRDLLDLHVLLLRPDVDLGDGRRGADVLPLGDDDRAFVREAMRQRPRDSADPVYDPAHYADAYSKFLAPGIWRALGAERVDVLDKVGRAYGFSATNSYVEDRATGRAFFLAATLYTNADGVLNDDQYEYDLADRFFADLGEALVRELGFAPAAKRR